MLWFNRNREFLKQMYTLALPIALQNLIWSSLSLVDNIIVAGLGEKPLAIVTLINQYFFVFYLVQFGITSGASIFAAQFWGNKDIPNIKRVLGVTLITMMGCSLMFFIPVVLFPDLILGIFTDDKSIISEGRNFLKIMGFSNIFLSISASFMFIQRSIGNVKMPLVISSISLVINTTFNYILIYGLFSMPIMGLDGSAFATLIARLVEVSLVLIFVYGVKNQISGRFREIFDLKSDFIKSFYKITSPVIFNEIIWSVGISTYYIVYGRMGTEAIAAISITSTIEKISFTLLMGLGSACGIIVGHKIGEGKEDEAYDIGKKYLVSVLVSGLITGLILIAGSRTIISLFNVSSDVIEIALKNIFIFAVFNTFRGLNFACICGILRSGADTKFCFILEAMCLWLLGVPLVFLCGFILKAPVHIVYLVVSFEEIIKMIFVLKRFKSKKWINNITEIKKEA